MVTLGLASMLGLILKTSQAGVVRALNPPVPARQALLEQAGPLHVYLQVAAQVEAQTPGLSNILADQFGGTSRILALSDQAWAWSWAAEHADRGGTAGASKRPDVVHAV